ncbi:hypothetical protein [Sphingomonas sp. LT1P40]|uniref:hypothetical protein n=1 Tax=Alteristakelama amylovorans TaxID=3096166 RepID=UPI002FC7AA42
MTNAVLSARLGRYRRLITLVWWLGGALLILLVLGLAAVPSVSRDTHELLGWLLPHVLPSMTLTGAVAYFAGPPKTVDTKPEEMKFLFRLALTASVFYLLVLVIVIIVSLLALSRGQQGILVERLQDWNIVIGVMQALPASAIGVFFAKN